MHLLGDLVVIVGTGPDDDVHNFCQSYPDLIGVHFELK